MNWNDIQYFVNVAKTGSLSAAAGLMKVSQPTVGRRIDALEKQIGKRLFKRTAHGLSLTCAGDMLLPHAEKITSEVANFYTHPGLSSDELAGRVKLRLGELSGQFVAQNLHNFRKNFPGIQIELEANSEKANLSRKEVDIALVANLPTHGDLVSKKLAHYTHAIYGGKNYVEQAPDAWTEKRYETCDWITTPVPGECNTDHLWLMDKMVNNDPVVYCRTFNGMHSALEGGAGLAICAAFFVDQNPNLIRVSDKIDELSFDLWIVAHKDILETPRVRVCWDWIIGLYHANKTRFEDFQSGLECQLAGE